MVMKMTKKSIAILIMWINILALLTGCGQSEAHTVDEGVRAAIDQLVVTFYNTGKSDAILIEMDELVILNDTADADDYDMLYKSLQNKAITSIDWLIISHFDKDHIGSATKLISNFDVKHVLMPNYAEDSYYYKSMMQEIKNRNIPVTLLVNEDYTISSANGELQINGGKEPYYEDDNNYSLITAIHYGNHKMLLMGDALKKRTEEILDTQLGQEDYLLIKVPHHGDYNKKLRILFEQTKPEYAVITEDAKRERLEDKLLELLEEEDVKAFFTMDGTIELISDGTSFDITQ